MNSDDDSESFDIHDDQQLSLITFSEDRKWLRHHYVMNMTRITGRITPKYLFPLVYNLSRNLIQIDSIKHYFWLCIRAK